MKNVIKSKIAGISLHQDVISEIVPGDELLLVREPDNRYDANAIKVLSTAKKQLGYVNRKLAFDVARAMDEGVAVKCFACMVTGANQSLKGVNIEIQLGASA